MGEIAYLLKALNADSVQMIASYQIAKEKSLFIKFVMDCDLALVMEKYVDVKRVIRDKFSLFPADLTLCVPGDLAIITE